MQKPDGYRKIKSAGNTSDLGKYLIYMNYRD